jgi:hypothetical protein
MANDAIMQQIIQSLLAPQVKPAMPMMGSLVAPAPEAAPTFLGMLPPANAHPGGALQVIDPGASWGGHDVNAIDPNAFMTNKVYDKPLQQEDI